MKLPVQQTRQLERLKHLEKFFSSWLFRCVLPRSMSVRPGNRKTNFNFSAGESMAARLPALLHLRVPWKNGLGVSRVIATGPSQEAGYDSLHWQVSGTEIGADCPFSALPGLDRYFTVRAPAQHTSTSRRYSLERE